MCLLKKHVLECGYTASFIQGAGITALPTAAVGPEDADQAEGKEEGSKGGRGKREEGAGKQKPPCSSSTMRSSSIKSQIYDSHENSKNRMWKIQTRGV